MVSPSTIRRTGTWTEMECLGHLQGREASWTSGSFTAEGDHVSSFNQAGEGKWGQYEEQNLYLNIQRSAHTLMSDLGHQKSYTFILLLFKHSEKKK